MSMDIRRIETYQDALSYLFEQLPSLRRKPGSRPQRKKDLALIRAFCSGLQNPHLKYPVIHVAGTNGKGTVSHMIAAFLQANGWKTGLYTSPHYLDYRERIRINGQMIPRNQVIDFLKGNAALINRFRPTFFELTAAMAFRYFAEEGVDVVVLETGLGGRLDSTNIVSPVLTVITNIGLDHQGVLGDTVEKIAIEKAGIIKPGIPIIIGEHGTATDPIFIEKAGEQKAPIIFADEKEMLSRYEMVDRGMVFNFEGSANLPATIIKTDLAGPFQAANLRTALSALEVILSEHIFDLDARLSLQGLESVKESTGYQGRWERYPGSPDILVDSGHNLHSLPVNIKHLSSYGYRQLHIVLGMVGDKEHGPILKFFPKEAHYYFVRPNVPRGLSEITLKHKAKQVGLEGDAFEDIQFALRAATKNAHQNDLIFIGGSTFVVADYLRIQKMKSMKLPKIVKKSPYVVTLEPRRYAWCTCGLSAKDPFCNGSHKEIEGFKSLGFEVEEEKKVALCACKHTKTPPYCDGSHKHL